MLSYEMVTLICVGCSIVSAIAGMLVGAFVVGGRDSDPFTPDYSVEVDRSPAAPGRLVRCVRVKARNTAYGMQCRHCGEWFLVGDEVIKTTDLGYIHHRCLRAYFGQVC